jgi:hypothetical protein
MSRRGATILAVSLLTSALLPEQGVRDISPAEQNATTDFD